MFQSVNPATGMSLRSFDTLSPEALEGKLAMAWEARHQYARESGDQRRFWMRRLALLLEGDAEELAAIITTEMGKPILESRSEIEKSATVCRFYAEHAAAMLEPERIPTEWEQSYVRWDPLGVLLAVMPWNFPFWQVFRFLAPALMAGNVALLKHAPNVPQCALAIEALVRRAGFPRGTLQVLFLDEAAAAAVIADPRVAAVTLTGSEAAGSAVAAVAGAHLKKSVLELGGSDPFLVLPSAALATATENAVRARCINSGQSCIAAKRFLVHEAVFEEFTRGLVAGMAALRLGDPRDPSTEVGPLARADLAEHLQDQVRRALDAGGHLLLGGDRLPGNGFFFAPTVITNLPSSARIAQEEFFGPVALLFRVGSLDEAIVLANSTPFGLGASCWTQEAAERERLSAELEAGAVFFNAPVASDPRLPFGGVKRSGYGRELSAAGMREFMNAKTIAVSGARYPSSTPARLAPVEEIEAHEPQLAVPSLVFRR